MYSAKSDEVGRRSRDSPLSSRSLDTMLHSHKSAHHERTRRTPRRSRVHTGARSEATLQTTLILTSCGGPIVGSGLWTLCSLSVPQRATARTLDVRVVFSQRAISGPGASCAHAHRHTCALSAVRLLLKARCPRGIIHCERGASRKRNDGITADNRWLMREKRRR